MSTLLSTVLLFLCVYILGFLAAIPVGATQIEIARRSLAGFLRSAFAVALGSISSDLVYGSIAMFGLGTFFQNPEVEAIFWLINAVLTMILGIASLRESAEEEAEPPLTVNVLDVPVESRSKKRRRLRTQPEYLKKSRTAYVAGFSLAFTNPMMIAWWLLAARILKDVGLIHEFGLGIRAMFVLAGVLGIGSYLFLLATTTYRAHKSVSKKRTKKVTRYFGIAMIVLSIYFVVRAIQVITSNGGDAGLKLGAITSIIPSFAA